MLPGLKTPWENDGDSGLPVEAQLQRLRGIAMLVGFNEAAEWINTHAKATFVWVDTGGKISRKPLWAAKSTDQSFIIQCALCEQPAEALDNFYPYHVEQCRCAAHAGMHP